MHACNNIMTTYDVIFYHVRQSLFQSCKTSLYWLYSWAKISCYEIYIPYYLANTPPLEATPPPIVLMKTTAQVLLSVKTLTVTNNLCDVYKILYYAAVHVRGYGMGQVHCRKGIIKRLIVCYFRFK